MTAEQLAQLFHETYERLAPDFGCETRTETAIPWPDIPADSANKRLMIAVAGEMLSAIASEEADLRPLVADFDAYLRLAVPRAYRSGRAKSLRQRAEHAKSVMPVTESEAEYASA